MRHERSRVDESDARGVKHDDCDVNTRQILLKRQIAIASDEDLELRLSQGQQTPVLDAIPAHVLDCLHFVAR